jgi:hypothetical protein
MKHTLKVYHAQVQNMGDLLNEYLIKDYFGYNLVRHNPLTCELSGIGSGLGQFTFSDNLAINIAEKVIGLIHSPVYIWGTGFISETNKDKMFYRKNMIFSAVRGKLSKSRVEVILGKSVDMVTGDGGILASELLKKKVEKKFKVGIIPHYKEQSDITFIQLQQKFKNSILINVRKNPINVIEEIAACDYIISSSLHGLIVADSFSIPNQHVIVSNALLGDGFKFKDYYSAYDVIHNPIDMKQSSITSVNTIIDNYKITTTMVENRKHVMANCFPY